MNERLKILREHLNISQETLGEKINVTRSHISSIEKGKRALTDRVITDICREFNVNEEWLRNGTEPMFIEPVDFSLDAYAKSKGATDLDLEIIKGYLDIPIEFRTKILSSFKDSILKNIKNMKNNDILATKEETFEERKQRELDAYALELDAQEKGRILSVSEKPKGA